MSTIARTDSSLIGRWWWTIDKWLLAAVALLLVVGLMLTFAASPAVAEHIGASEFSFVRKHLVFAFVAVGVLLGCSILDRRSIILLGILGLFGSIVLVVATLIFGDATKGATRWLNFAGFSLQPSEFTKPFFAVIVAWLLSLKQTYRDLPVTLFALGLTGLIVLLLMMQPDLGMSVVVTAIFGVQIFLAGLPLILVLILGGLGIAGVAFAYFRFDHVRSRIDGFLGHSELPFDDYQLRTSLNAFREGGFLGLGPGEGQVKHLLPDAHADFIFAVAGEEFGLIFCLILVMLFTFVMVRGFRRLWNTEDLFPLIAGAGLLTQFVLQALINMGSTLGMIPTKGMTLPFLSYGGSSLLSLAMAMGLVLALTRAVPGRSSSAAFAPNSHGSFAGGVA